MCIRDRFTPVKKVNYQVENTRVGQMVDYDKLTIEVWTDGSLKAYDCLLYTSGTNNPRNVGYATMNALENMATAESIAKKRGKKVEEI